MRYPNVHWQVIRQAYLASHLSIAEFYRKRFALFFAQGETIPALTAVYWRFQQMAARECSAAKDAPPAECSMPPAINITSLGTEGRLVRFDRDIIDQVMAGSSVQRKAPCRRQERVIRMTLPSGVRVEVATASPEKLALEAMLMLSREPA